MLSDSTTAVVGGWCTLKDASSRQPPKGLGELRLSLLPALACSQPVLHHSCVPSVQRCSRSAEPIAHASTGMFACRSYAGFYKASIFTLKLGLILAAFTFYEAPLFCTLVARKLGAPRRAVVVLWGLGITTYTGEPTQLLNPCDAC